MRVTPEKITELGDGQFAVVPTNQSGIHGAGFARKAYLTWGIERGVGEGFSGHCYLLPTKDWNIKTRPLADIAISVNRFFNAAKEHPHITFLVPAVGCGLAGLSPEQIAPLFKGAPENVHLPASFWAVLNNDK